MKSKLFLSAVILLCAFAIAAAYGAGVKFKLTDADVKEAVSLGEAAKETASLEKDYIALGDKDGEFCYQEGAACAFKNNTCAAAKRGGAVCVVLDNKCVEQVKHSKALCSGNVLSKYLWIAEHAAKQAAKGQGVDKDKVGMFRNGKTLAFSFCDERGSKDFAQYENAALKIGGKVIQPSDKNFTGKDDTSPNFSESSNTWYTCFVVEFPEKGIDPRAKPMLIITNTRYKGEHILKFDLARMK